MSVPSLNNLLYEELNTIDTNESNDYNHTDNDVHDRDVVDRQNYNENGRSRSEWADLNVQIKATPRADDNLVDNVFMSALANIRASMFINVFQARTVVLVNLEDIILFQYLEATDIPDNVYIIAFAGRTIKYHYHDQQFYQRFSSYNELKRRNSVQVVINDGRRQNAAMAQLQETYQSLDNQLDASIKIIVMATSNGVLQGQRATNERGRQVQLLDPKELLRNGPGARLGDYLI